MSKTRLGGLMRQVRAREGWTCRHAAELLGMSPEHYANVEHGRALPRPSRVCVYARAFGTDEVAWLEALFQAIADRLKIGVRVTCAREPSRTIHGTH